MNKTPTLSEVAEMIRAKVKPVWELDQAFWACEFRVDYPLTHYDLEHWEEACREGAPEARLVSDAGALTRYIEDTWPQHRITISSVNGETECKVAIDGLGVRLSSSFSGVLPLSHINRGLAIAFADVQEQARDLQRRLSTVYGVAESTPHVKDWPIEEFEPDRFHSVLHDRQLAAAEFSSRKNVELSATLDYDGDYDMLLCRERYLKLFPSRDPDTEGPSP